MTKLQALTLVRDAVATTKGVYAGLWYDGPNRHCAIGAITQVAVDCGFDEQLAKSMIGRARREIGSDLEKKIVKITDDPKYGHLSPQQRREHILKVLNDAIARENEKQQPVPDSPKELTDAKPGAAQETVGVHAIRGESEKARA